MESYRKLSGWRRSCTIGVLGGMTGYSVTAAILTIAGDTGDPLGPMLLGILFGAIALYAFFTSPVEVEQDER